VARGTTSAAVLASLTLHSCVILGRENWTHVPPLATNVPRIVKGQTTRAEVLDWFGEPDLETEQGQAKANLNMAMIRSYWPADTGIPEPLKADLERAFPYSGIDENHEALLYVEQRNTSVLILPGGGTAHRYVNRLLLLVNRKTAVVDGFWYQAEF